MSEERVVGFYCVEKDKKEKKVCLLRYIFFSFYLNERKDGRHIQKNEKEDGREGVVGVESLLWDLTFRKGSS